MQNHGPHPRHPERGRVPEQDRPWCSHTSTCEKPCWRPGVLTLEGAPEARGWGSTGGQPPPQALIRSWGAAQGSAFSVSAQVQPTSRSDLGWAQCQTWLHAGHPGALRPYSKRPRQSMISLGCSPSSGLGTTGAKHWPRPAAPDGSSGLSTRPESTSGMSCHGREPLKCPRTPQMPVHRKRKSLEAPGAGLATLRARKLYSAAMAAS